jgi:hypothetical protein
LRRRFRGIAPRRASVALSTATVLKTTLALLACASVAFVRSAREYDAAACRERA